MWLKYFVLMTILNWITLQRVRLHRFMLALAWKRLGKDRYWPKILHNCCIVLVPWRGLGSGFLLFLAEASVRCRICFLPGRQGLFMFLAGVVEFWAVRKVRFPGDGYFWVSESVFSLIFWDDSMGLGGCVLGTLRRDFWSGRFLIWASEVEMSNFENVHPFEKHQKWRAWNFTIRYFYFWGLS